MKIVADDHIPLLDDYFAPFGELVRKPGREISSEDLQGADLLLVRSITRVDEKLLAGTTIKFVGSVTAGADHLDTYWLDEAGIKWSVAQGFNAPPVADYVVSVVAALQRKHLLATSGLRAAVIGVGRVGQLVASRLAILGFEVILCDPLRALTEKDFQSVPLAEIAEVDLISLHVPLTMTGDHATYHFIDKAFLKRQKPGAVLLNASRGAVIDSQIMMLHGTHLAWCLDVWEGEPHLDKNMLNRAVIATPHIAGYSVQSKIRGVEMIYRAAAEALPVLKASSFPRGEGRLELQQQLVFSGDNHHWQDIVLGVFNPLIMTAMMRTQLLPDEAGANEFDVMRNKFSYRHEFAFTKVVGAKIISSDKEILAKLGLECLGLH